MRDWQVKRRERTRQLIELGGLVAKAGLVDLTDDDRTVIYGALLAVADRFLAEPERAKTMWGRRGRRAFASDQNDEDSAAESDDAGGQ